MSDRSFVDTNVLVYLVSGELKKKRQAEDRIAAAPAGEKLVVSTQILGEFVNVCLKRKLLAHDGLVAVLSGFVAAFEVIQIRHETLNHGLLLRRRYGYAWWDSLVLASALEAKCSVLYTEDLQHGQVIESSLRIVNPFVPTP